MQAAPHLGPWAAWRDCAACVGSYKDVAMASQWLPEMEPVYAWFDQALGSADGALNPRSYCEIM